MGVFDSIFGMGRSQGGQPPVNPNVRNDPNDQRLSPQERNQALQQRQQQPQPGATNTPAPGQGAMNNAAPGSGGSPVNGNTPTPGGGESSPLDDYSKIWETSPEQKGSAGKKWSYPKFDNNKLNERVSQMNFIDHIPQELLGKAAAGDAAALGEVLNHVGRRAFQTGFSATNALNSQVFDQFGNSIDERIPQQVRGLQTQQAVFGEMKGLNHPAVAPMLKPAIEQIQAMYPDASPEEIKEHAKKYLYTMAQVITGQIGSEEGSGANNTSGSNSSQSAGRGITDFSTWDS